MSTFVELTDFEGNKFIFQKADINVVFLGGVDSEDEEWVGEPAVVVVVNDTPTKITETYEEVRKLLL